MTFLSQFSKGSHFYPGFLLTKDLAEQFGGVIGKKRQKVLGEVLLFSNTTLLTVSLLLFSLKAAHFMHSQSLCTSPCCWGSSSMVYIRTQPDLKSSYIRNIYSCKTSKLSDICFLKWAHMKLLCPLPLNNALELTPYTLLTANINQYYKLPM